MGNDVWMVYLTICDGITGKNVEDLEMYSYETREEAKDAIKENVRLTAEMLKNGINELYIIEEDTKTGRVCATDGNFNYVTYEFYARRTMAKAV